MSDDLPIIVEHLGHAYGQRVIYSDLNLKFSKGKIYGLLGKNGVGKTTLIKIMMGFLKPVQGTCRIFGDPANAIRPETRARVGLLFERHLTYNFFTIEQVEKFMSSFYRHWKRENYYELVDVLGLPKKHKIAHMSEGQRSQVVLGLILAQDPDLLILDDYSMGLDAGYRRLFVDYLTERLKDGQHTVVLTSHVIQDMERFVDDVIFLRRGGQTLSTSLTEFMQKMHCFHFSADLIQDSAKRAYLERLAFDREQLVQCQIINIEAHKTYYEIFSFAERHEVQSALAHLGFTIAEDNLKQTALDVEDAFVGYTGRC